MHLTNRPLGRITAIAAAVTLTFVQTAIAQSPPRDPPARVGRLAGITGTVSYHLANADRWEPAVVNLPLTDGTAVWTEPASRADLGIGPNRIALDSSTEFDIARLDDHTLTATQPQGGTYLHLRAVPAGDSYMLQTPRGVVVLATVGRYEVVAGDQEHPTLVTVLDGAAQVTGAATPVQVGPNQTLTITGDGTTTPFQPALGAAVHDAFLDAMLAAERPARTAGVAPPAYVARMTGGDALEEYGDWAATSDYGTVWYPRVEPGFVPYRNGHWAYVQPWGWTWVDAAPWGFAPSHYGRWVEINNRWGWTPGYASPGYASPVEAVPVYAPAVVGFLGGAAVGALGVGWVPLGPREPYRPPYRTSDRYVRQVNQLNVQNLTTINNYYGGRGRPAMPLVNRAAATAVPAEAMTGSRNLAQLARPLPPGIEQRPGPVSFRPPLAPTLATAGMTPAVARQLNLPAAAPPVRPAAPGPSLDPNAFRRAGGPGAQRQQAGAIGAGATPGPAGGFSRPTMPIPSGSPLPQFRPIQPAAGPEPRPDPRLGAPGPAITRPGAVMQPVQPGPAPGARLPVTAPEPRPAAPPGAIAPGPNRLPGAPPAGPPGMRFGTAPAPIGPGFTQPHQAGENRAALPRPGAGVPGHGFAPPPAQTQPAPPMRAAPPPQIHTAPPPQLHAPPPQPRPAPPPQAHPPPPQHQGGGLRRPGEPGHP